MKGESKLERDRLERESERERERLKKTDSTFFKTQRKVHKLE